MPTPALAKQDTKTNKNVALAPVPVKQDDKKVVAAAKKDEKVPAPVKEAPKPATVAKKDEKPAAPVKDAPKPSVPVKKD